MVERLKQIWSGFEQTTSRRLSGRGVDNIVLPERPAARAPSTTAEPEKLGVGAPAEAAFAALRAKLLAGEKRRAEAPRETASAAPSFGEGLDFGGAPDAARDLVRGLAATEARVGREFRLYDAAAHGAAARPKKRLFGLF